MNELSTVDLLLVAPVVNGYLLLYLSTIMNTVNHSVITALAPHTVNNTISPQYDWRIRFSV